MAIDRIVNTLDKWRALLIVPNRVVFPHLELLAGDHEPPIVVGSGEVQWESLDRFSFKLWGIPADAEYALSAASRHRHAPYDGLARPRLVGISSDGVAWSGGYAIPHIDAGRQSWTFTGEIESLSTDDEGVAATAQMSTELLFPLRVNDPMNVAMARFARTIGPGKELVREREIVVLGAKIRFAYETDQSTLSITASHSVALPIPYAESWLTEPLRILFGQLLFPRLVARNYESGRSTVWIRRTPDLIRGAGWASLLRKEPDDNDFWRLYAQLLAFIAQARNETGDPNFEANKITRLYEEVAQASRGSRWVWALTFASCVEALVRMIIPKGLSPSESEATAAAIDIDNVAKHITGYLSENAMQARLKNLAINAVRRDSTINTSRAMRALEATGIISKEQINAWNDIRHAVAHGSLLSPYSNAEEDEKLLRLASMMHALTRELLRRS